MAKLFVLPPRIVSGNPVQFLLELDPPTQSLESAWTSSSAEVGVSDGPAAASAVNVDIASKLIWTVTQVASPPTFRRVFDHKSGTVIQSANNESRLHLTSLDLPGGTYKLAVGSTDNSVTALETVFTVAGSAVDQIAANDGVVEVSLQQVTPTADQSLWNRIRCGARTRDFTRYERFILLALRGNTDEFKDQPNDPAKLVNKTATACYLRYGTRGFEFLKAATEIFLLCDACCDECHDLDCVQTDSERQEESARLGVEFNHDQLVVAMNDYLASSVSPSTLPYLGQILANLSLAASEDLERYFPFWIAVRKEQPDGTSVFTKTDAVRRRLCLLELIWSYWHEEGMLVQSINAVSMRFQNRRVRQTGVDPLANFALDPLRPLNNLLWGYIQDQQHHLSLSRRAHEYVHEYGLTIQGKAVGQLSPVESRSRFLEAFHDLLHAASVYYKEITNKFVQPDAFPILDKLRTVHLILAEGAVNQFGDLPTTARQEMLVQQWLLAQQPMRDFLQSRATIPYEEPWMGQVDAMKRMMGWHEASVMHFQRLAVNGEMLVLSLRFGDWANANRKSGANAENWLRYWKPEVQNYIEAYRAVTRVDLSAIQQPTGRVDATMPSLLLQRQLRPVAARP